MGMTREASIEATFSRLHVAIYSGDAEVISKAIDEVVDPGLIFHAPVPGDMWGVQALKAAAPPTLPRLDEVGLDPVALGFTTLAVIVTGLLFGLVPAMRGSASALHATLSAGGRAAIGGGRGERVPQQEIQRGAGFQVALRLGHKPLRGELDRPRRPDIAPLPAPERGGVGGVDHGHGPPIAWRCATEGARLSSTPPRPRSTPTPGGNLDAPSPRRTGARWDRERLSTHPAQIPVRFATCYAFFLEGFAQAADRLRNFIEKAAQATLVGDVFDDAATGQGLLNYFLRALNSGARR